MPPGQPDRPRRLKVLLRTKIGSHYMVHSPTRGILCRSVQLAASAYRLGRINVDIYPSGVQHALRRSQRRL
jgi:hypothetical protein